MKSDTKPLATSHLRRFLPALFLGAALIGLAAPRQAQAITYGAKDGNAHPYVGMVVFYDAGGVRMYRCTGTLISPTVFLTAGHCAQGFPDRPAASARIYFQSEVDTNTSSYFTGTPIPNPGFEESFGGGVIQPISHDVAVVILDVAVAMETYGELAPEGTLDKLTGPKYKNLTFDVVGYGVQDWTPVIQAETVRYWSTPKRVTEGSALTDYNYIHHSANNGTVNNGGSCNGDSGGPIFLAGTSIIVGVTSWGIDLNCAGPSIGYRTDIAESLDFINLFPQ
jgi:secreted trypsin-like serine protease